LIKFEKGASIRRFLSSQRRDIFRIKYVRKGRALCHHTQEGKYFKNSTLKNKCWTSKPRVVGSINDIINDLKIFLTVAC